MTGLDDNTEYIVRVRATCPSGYTVFSLAETFTTDMIPPKMAEASSFEQMEISLYPNPTNGFFNLLIDATDMENGDVTIEIFNLVGQTIYSHTEQMQGQRLHAIDLSNNPAGQYLVKVKMNGEVRTATLSLIK